MRLLLSAFLLVASMSAMNGFVLMESAVPKAMETFTITGQPDPTTMIELVFHGKVNPVTNLEDMLMSISDPASPNYGKHFTKAEVDAMTANPDATKAIVTFLGTVPGVTYEIKGHSHISASAPVASWESVLSAKFNNYERVDGKGMTVSVIRTAEYSLPEEVATHVSAVFNTVQFPVELLRTGPVLRSGAHMHHTVHEV